MIHMFLRNSTTPPTVGQCSLQFLATLWIPHALECVGPFFFLPLFGIYGKSLPLFHNLTLISIISQKYCQDILLSIQTIIIFSVLTLYPLYIILLLH